MDLKEIGELLRQERDKQGLSLDDIIQKTKISRANLQAIEKGDHEALPHPVYAKGFVKNYAHFLGLDVEEISNLFARNYALAEEEFEDGFVDQETEGDASPGFEPIGEKSAWPIISIALTVVLVLVLGWLIYDVYFKSSNGETNLERENKALSLQTNNTNSTGQDMNQTNTLRGSETDSEKEIRDVLLDNQTEKSAKEQDEANNTSISEDVTQEMGNLVTEDSSEPVLKAEEQETVAESNATANETKENIQASQENEQKKDEQQAANQEENKKHEVQISANEACWFNAQFDGKDRDVYLRPGEGISLHFSESLKLRLGNAGGVDIVYDGKDYPMDVQSGEVKTLNFP